MWTAGMTKAFVQTEPTHTIFAMMGFVRKECLSGIHACITHVPKVLGLEVMKIPASPTGTVRRQGVTTILKKRLMNA